MGWSGGIRGFSSPSRIDWEMAKVGEPRPADREFEDAAAENRCDNHAERSNDRHGLDVFNVTRVPPQRQTQ